MSKSHDQFTCTTKYALVIPLNQNLEKQRNYPSFSFTIADYNATSAPSSRLRCPLLPAIPSYAVFPFSILAGSNARRRSMPRLPNYHLVNRLPTLIEYDLLLSTMRATANTRASAPSIVGFEVELPGRTAPRCKLDK